MPSPRTALSAGWVALAAVALGSAAAPPVLTPDRPIETSFAPGDLTGQRLTATFAPPDAGTWSVGVATGLLDPRLEVRARRPDGSWVLVGSADAVGHLHPVVSFDAAPGQTFEVTVEGNDVLACGATFELSATAGRTATRPDDDGVAARDRYWSDLLRDARGRGDARCEVRALLGQHAAARHDGRLPEAGTLADQAIATAEERLDPSDPFVGWTLDAKARLLREQGLMNDAVPLQERAERIIEAHYGPLHAATADGLLNLAALYGELDRDQERLALTERALDIRRRTLAPDDIRMGDALGDMGIACLAAGDLRRARDFMEQVVAIAEGQNPQDPEDIAAALNNLAYVERKLGDDEAARHAFERALGIFRAAGPTKKKALARTAGNLGRVMEDLGDPEAARALYEEALSITVGIYGPEHAVPAGYELHLARILAYAGHDDEAVARAAKAVAVFESTLGPRHTRTANALASEAEIELQVGVPERALPLVDRAIAIGEALLGPEHPDLAGPLRLRAAIEIALGNDDDALAAALRAEDLGRNQLRLTARALAEAPALRYAATRPRGLDLALRLSAAATAPAPGFQRQVWDSLIRSRALVLDEMARRRALLANGDTETAHLRDQFVEAGARLARLLVRAAEGDDPGDVVAQIDAARRERDRKEEALASKSATFQAGRRDAAVGFAEIAERLGAGEALVSYARVDRAAGGRHRPGTPYEGAPPDEIYVAFVVRGPGGAPRLVTLAGAPTIDAAVTRWRASLTAAPHGLGGARDARARDLRAAGTSLREAIWDPVAAALASAGDAGAPALTTVFVVPDGALALVSLAALPAGDRRFLIEDSAAIQMLSAERDLAADARAPGSGGAPGTDRALVVGGPDFDAGEGAPLPTRFPPLPEASAEATEVAGSLRRARLADVTLLTGRHATESAFERLAPGSRYLHLATHAFWSAADLAATKSDAPPAAGASAPAGRASSPADVLVHGAENPLDVSGVALAGANRRAGTGATGVAAPAAPAVDDGILTADEVATLDLTAAGWVVLSGCDTGIGRPAPGEGLLGLQRAFRVAGARGLIVSLWQVPDLATRAWMREVYAQARAGATPAAALRRAARRWLAAQRAAGGSTSPEVWGAFIATGPSR